MRRQNVYFLIVVILALVFIAFCGRYAVADEPIMLNTKSHQVTSPLTIDFGTATLLGLPTPAPAPLTLTGDVTGTGTGSVATTIANNAVTSAKIAATSVTNAKLAVMAPQTIKGNAGGTSIAPADLTVADTKTLLSLNNVENTALSTWPGSTNLTTLGTVTTGTWSGNPIATAKGGVPTGGATNTVLMKSGATDYSTTWGTIANGNMATMPTLTLKGNNTGVASAPLDLTATQVKTMLNLNNVENTALSTWPGSANLTTLGTITTGTWAATPLGTTYGGAPTGGGTGQVLTKNSATNYDYTWSSPAGTGTVTNVTSGNASPLFNVSISNPTTTPAFSFIQQNAAAGTVFANNGTLAATPGFVTNPRISAIANLTTNGFVKTGGATGALSVDTNTYLTGNQTITLTGDVTGSGTTSINAQIGTGVITATEIAANAIGASEINNTQDMALAAAQTITLSDSGTTSAPNVLTLGHNSSGTPSTNFGESLAFNAKSDTTNSRTLGAIAAQWTTATDASRTSKISIKPVSNGTQISNGLIVFGSGGVAVNTNSDPGSGVIYPPNGIQAVSNNSTAAAGIVGETISANLASGSATSLSNNVNKNILSISLTAGDWDVHGVVSFNAINVASTGTEIASANISTTSATLPDDGEQSYTTITNGTAAAQTLIGSCQLPSRRVNLSTTTTVYLVGKNVFNTGTSTAFGFIEARRVR